ncbi:MAG: hypothetical protein JWP38_2283 [Herbaspirillum sp.]|nr:hypothetical protein [Herbaspirillum sp.]
MAIDVLLTGTVVSACDGSVQNGEPRLKVTLEARDANGCRVNVVCPSGNDRVAGGLGILEIGQSACVRGHAVVPLNHKGSDKIPRIYVNVTDVIVLN